MDNYMFYKVSCYDRSRHKRFTFNPMLYDAYNKDSAFKFANRIKKEFSSYYSSIRVVECNVEVKEVYVL